MVIGELNTAIKGFDASCFDGVYVTGDVSVADIARLSGARISVQEDAQDSSRLALPNPAD
jgi:amidophosphoribosyltransferase